MAKATLEDVGKTKLCPVCMTNGVEVQIHAVETEYQGTTRYSWKNEDNGSHIKKVGDSFEHQIKSAGAQSTPSTSVGEGFREATQEQKEFLHQVIKMDDLYNAVAVSQVKKRGADLRGDIIAHEKEMLIRLRMIETVGSGLGSIRELSG